MELHSGFWTLFSAHTSVLLESRDLAAKGLRLVYPLRMRLASTFSKHPTFDSDGSCASYRGTLACLKKPCSWMSSLVEIVQTSSSVRTLWHVILVVPVLCAMFTSWNSANSADEKSPIAFLNPQFFESPVCYIQMFAGIPIFAGFILSFAEKKMKILSAPLACWNTNVPLYLMVVHHKPFFPSRLSKAPFVYVPWSKLAYMAHIQGMVINPLRIYNIYIYIYTIYIYSH